MFRLQCHCGLKSCSAAARMLGSRVTIPLRKWNVRLLSLLCVVQLTASTTSWSLVQRSPIVCLYVSNCVNLETSTISRSRPDFGCCVTTRLCSQTSSINGSTTHKSMAIFIHSVFCLTTGPKPPPKRFLRKVRSRDSSFKWEYPLLSLRSSSSFLRLLPCLLVTSISPFIFPSITWFRRQFLCKMWPIQLALHFLFHVGYSSAHWL